MSGSKQPRPLHHKILFGLLLGAVVGAIANQVGARQPEAQEVIVWLADGVAHPIGQIFLRLLFLVVVPLVFASLSVGVASLGDLRKVGRIGARTLVFFLITTGCSVLLGLTALNLFQPGAGFDEAARDELMRGFGADAAKLQETATANTSGGLLDTVNRYLDMFLPRNVLQAVVDMRMLPLVVASLVFGLALSAMDEDRRAGLVGTLTGLGEAMVRIVGYAMRLAPAAVFCLIFAVVAKFGLDLLQKLALYVLIVLGCYVVQLFLLYPLLLSTLCRRSPLEFLRRASPVMITAFSTSSSNATLPTSLRVSQESLGIRSSVAGFVLPLGATMNMNGTALFEGALVLFLAQVFGVDLSLTEQALVVLLCVFSAVGAAGVPGGALPLIMVILAQVGVPPDGIAIVLGVDRILDMGRTVVNVTGDLVCATWVERGEALTGLPASAEPPLRPVP